MSPSLGTIEEKLYTVNEYGVRYQNPNAVLSQEDAVWLRDTYGVRDDWHPTCVNCQARQLIKYRDAKEKDGTPIRNFRVPCSGIPSGLGPGTLEKRDKMATQLGITKDRAAKLLLSTQDPVAWAELFFGFDDAKKTWRLRPYQKEQLRCSSKRIVIREGRRAGKTFIAALKLLYLALTRKIPAGFDSETGEQLYTGPEIMVVTPYQSQILNIFDEIEKLLKRNKELTGRVTTNSGGSLYVKTPFFHMDFDNGALIKGFVSGVGTKVDGSGGGTMRGQNASIIYLDEMDMIPDEVLDKVVMPILLTDQEGNVVLIATSTPIGKRGRFHNWCLDDPTFKEDHLPSTVLPQWDKIKSMLESEGTNESFRAEYMAEFVEGGHGVFKPSLVFGARSDYRYNEMYNNNNWWRGRGVLERGNVIYCMGIDWNKNAGTEFVVVACDTGGSTNDIFGTKDKGFRYWVVEAVNISAGQFSADEWKKEVIRLNHKWQPHYIYADEGYGHTIIEDLRLLGVRFKGRASDPMQVSTGNLVERLKSFNFSSAIEMRSPVDGQVMKKSGKDFLVENAVRQFEDGRVFFSMYDDQLKKELLNYIVQRRSPTTNRPVYGPESETIGDHRLDAFMLALAGIQLEMGIYVNGGLVGTGAPAYIGESTLKERADHNRSDPLGIKQLFAKLRGTGAGNSKINSILPRREGESQDEAIRRAALHEHDLNARVKSRSRGMMSQDMSVYEYFNESAGVPAKLYETDQEGTWQPSNGPHVINPRGRYRRPRGHVRQAR